MFTGVDAQLYLHIGFFTVWFAAVELRISMLLAKATAITNLESFDLLTRGMDARVKLERLRAAYRKTTTFGPVLVERLDAFEKRILPLRNKIAHSYLATDDKYERVHFSSLSRLPFAAYGKKQIGEPPENFDFLKLFEHGLWLNLLSDDLQSLLYVGPPPKILEIKNPKSPPRQEAHPPSRRKPPRATAGKRERKRARKGQPLRGKKVDR